MQAARIAGVGVLSIASLRPEKWNIVTKPANATINDYESNPRRYGRVPETALAGREAIQR